MRKIFTLLIVAILATATSWAAEYTITFGNKATGATSIGTSVKATTAITGGLRLCDSKAFHRKQGNLLLRRRLRRRKGECSFR